MAASNVYCWPLSNHCPIRNIRYSFLKPAFSSAIDSGQRVDRTVTRTSQIAISHAV